VDKKPDICRGVPAPKLKNYAQRVGVEAKVGRSQREGCRSTVPATSVISNGEDANVNLWDKDIM
jgi:hypothetical protein